MPYSLRDAERYSVYFAPRGKKRMLNLGAQIGHLHLMHDDKLIGLIGEAGAGKSMLIKGMLPGLELSNDDEGINIRPLPILSAYEEELFDSHTYHLDLRFELGLTQLHELASAISAALNQGCRVIAEHFELVSDALGRNADLLIGVGSEVIVARPTLFGPRPEDICSSVSESLVYRKMVHSAEDLTEFVIDDSFGIREAFTHSDVKHGFVLEYEHMPGINIRRLEAEVKMAIEKDMPISFSDETHITIGGARHYCTGPRLHVRSTGEISGFKLLPEFKYDPVAHKHMLVGLIGQSAPALTDDINSINVD